LAKRDQFGLGLCDDVGKPAPFADGILIDTFRHEQPPSLFPHIGVIRYTSKSKSTAISGAAARAAIGGA
jgi:hypothetical protein